MQVSIRIATNDDVAAITDLSLQLGYTISLDATASNLKALSTSANDIVYVAVCNEIVVGWMHVFYTVRIESGQFCEIGGLVVNEAYRGKGIGKLLLAQARSWTIEKGCSKLRVRCNAKRIETHRFYIAAGYAETKEQKVFETKV